MKIVCISDTHCQLSASLPKGDVLVHTGDLTFMGTLQEMSKELKLLGDLAKQFKYALFLCGNHDWLGEKDPAMTRLLCKENNIIYLHDDQHVIEGIKFYGSPYQPEFNNWAFNLPRNGTFKGIK